MYVTRPTCKVAGEFEVARIISRPVDKLWQQTNAHAGIEADDFFKYFRGCDTGYAIVIRNAREYTTPQDLERTYGVRAPQSFLYL